MSSPPEQPMPAQDPVQLPAERPAELALAGIDGAVAGLDGLDAVPVAEHAEAFDRVHTALADALSAIDEV